MVGEYGSPYEPGSPEDIAFARNAVRGATIVGTQVLPAWASQVVPRGEDEQGNAHWALPGIVTGPYAALGTSLPAATNWLAGKAGFKTNLPSLPGAEAAAASSASTAKWAEDVIPHVQPQNEEEQRLAEMAFGGASMAIPGLGAGRLVSQLPRAAAWAVHAALPGVGLSTKGAATGALLTGAAGSYEDYQRDQILKAAGVDPAQAAQVRAGTLDPTQIQPDQGQQLPVPPIPPTVQKPATAAAAQALAPQPPATGSDQWDLSQPDTTQVVAHPQTGAAATTPFLTGSATTPATPVTDKYDTLAAFGRPDIKVVAPDFNTTGETGMSFAQLAGLGVLGTTAAVLGMRYSGKVLDPLIKAITGKGDQINNVTNVARFNANLDAVDRGAVAGHPTTTDTGAVRGEAPLPGKAGTVGTNFAQAAYDQNRVLTEMSNATAPNSGVAKQMEATIGTINNSTPLMNTIAEQMATGVNKANGGSVIPKFKEILQNYDNLQPAQVTKLETGLYSGDEMDTRTIKFNRAASAGDPINDDTAFRHNYRSVHSDDLRTNYADMMNDPATANVANQIYALQKANMIEAFQMGRITEPVMNQVLEQRPRQIPSTNNEGMVERALGQREIDTTGWDTPPTRAVDALTQHYSKLYAELQQNRLQDNLMQQFKLYQDANPGAARVVTELLDANGKPIAPPEGPAVGRRITTYRDGIAHTWEVDNTNLYRALKGGTAQTNMLLNTADSLRRSYQAGTTGVMGTVVAQRPFSLIGLNRYIPQIAVDRAPGTTFGMIDRAMQNATGGRVGYRGPDPTQWLGSYGEAIKGTGAVTARTMADSLRNPSNYITQTLRAVKGDAWVKSYADALEQRWARTNAAARRAEGASGVGLGGTYDRPTYNVATGNRVGYSPLSEGVPGVFHPDGIALPYTNVRIPGTKGAVSTYINMRTWLREVHQEIADGANSYYWKGMRDDPNITPEQRVFNTRQVIGDPSLHGASVAAQKLGHIVPWINPSIQDVVRMMRNLRDNPIAFSLGTVHSLGMAAVSSLLSAMLGGKKHLNMLSQLMSTHDRASNVTFFHNPDNEHDYTQISLPQRWRILYPILLEGAANGIGAFNMHQGEDTYNRVIHSLTDLFSSHLTHSTAVAAREGFADFAGIVQPPPMMQAAAALVGKRFNEPVSQVLKNVSEGQPWSANMLPDADKAGRLPGQAANSSYVGNDDANWTHNVLKSIFGVAADGYTHATNFTHRLAATHDLGEAVSGLVSDAGQSWRDNASFGNMIWGNNVKMTTRNPIEEANTAAYEKMRMMPQTKDLTLQGLTRPGGAAVGITGQPKYNTDPRIVQMVSTIHNYYNTINNTVEPHLKDINAQIKDMNENPYFGAQDKRTLLNNLVMKKNMLESQKSLQIEKLNAALSWMAGGKHVNVTAFDPKQGMEQFHD